MGKLLQGELEFKSIDVKAEIHTSIDDVNIDAKIALDLMKDNPIKSLDFKATKKF